MHPLQNKHKIINPSPKISETCMKLNGLLENLKENVPLVLVKVAKDLLETHIRDSMGESKAAGASTFFFVFVCALLGKIYDGVTIVSV